MFHKKARHEYQEFMKAMMECKLKEWESVCTGVQKIHRHVESLEKLNVNFDKELDIDMVLNFLPNSYVQFIMTYDLNNIETTLIKLHSHLQIDEARMKKSYSNNHESTASHDYSTRKSKKRKAYSQPKWKEKTHTRESGRSKGKPKFDAPHVGYPKEAI